MPLNATRNDPTGEVAVVLQVEKELAQLRFGDLFRRSLAKVRQLPHRAQIAIVRS